MKIVDTRGGEIELSDALLEGGVVEVSIDDMPGSQGPGASVILNSSQTLDLVEELRALFGWITEEEPAVPKVENEGKPPGPMVWLVIGSDGEYDSHRTWTVDAHTSKESADARVAGLSLLREEFEKALRVAGKNDEWDAPQDWLAGYRKRAGDEKFSRYAHYSVEAVPLVGAPERATCPAADLARNVMVWWEKHQHDVTGDYGEYNVYDSEPEFVAEARTILGLPE